MIERTVLAIRWGVVGVVTALTGIEWLFQPVSVPLIGLLVLTFVPTSALIETVRAMLKRVQDAQR